MAQRGKALYYRALKESGHDFEKHYRNYTEEELADLLQEAGIPLPAPEDAPPPRTDEVAEMRRQMEKLATTVSRLAEVLLNSPPEEKKNRFVEPQPSPSLLVPDPKEHAGITMNTHGEDTPLRTDEYGNVWYREEVRKPSFAKPRGRRVYKYEDPGVTREKTQVGEYWEEFEVAGDEKRTQPAEIKITLPSHQTGLYKPPNLPFRVHTYSGARGYHMPDVDRFFGGEDLVPDTVKRAYVSTTLVYDITSTNRTIEDEYRLRVLKTGALK